MKEEWRKMFPLTIGKEGETEYYLKFNNGVTVPWTFLKLSREEQEKYQEEFNEKYFLSAEKNLIQKLD